MDTPNEFDVFLSYNRHDLKAARLLAESLKAKSVKVWFDECSVRLGDDWLDLLGRAIQTAASVVVLVGRDGPGHWQDHEMRHAVTEFGRRVIPVLLPEATPQDLPWFLRRFSWLDFRDGVTESGIERLVRDITGENPTNGMGPAKRIGAVGTSQDRAEPMVIAIEMTLDQPRSSFDAERFKQALQRATGVSAEKLKLKIVEVQGGRTAVTIEGDPEPLREIALKLEDPKVHQPLVEQMYLVRVRYFFHPPGSSADTATEEIQIAAPPKAVPTKQNRPTDLYQGKQLYLAFVHYTTKLKIRTLNEFREKLAEDIEYLYEILKAKGDTWQGYAFVFLEEGWVNLLRENRQDVDLAHVLGNLIGFLEAKPKLDKMRWVTLVTAYQLGGLVQRLRDVMGDRAQQLWDLLAGARERLLYDAPKVIEAAVRIANIGRSTPVLRLDDDVIFYGIRHVQATRARSDEVRRTRRSIHRLCEHYRDLAKVPEIGYFVFSGGYCTPERSRLVQDATANRRSSSDLKHDLINGFATRTVPLAKLDVLHKLEKSETFLKWQRQAAEAGRENWKRVKLDLEETVLREFEIELSEDDAALFLQELYKYGANPFGQVISGAGLCLSDGAILDLPPFSNMHQSVVWIDDHLKYALHHELRHFGFLQGTRQAARVKNAVFKQQRLPGDAQHGRKPGVFDCKDMRWHLTDYLPRLVLGCVVDSWLRASPKLKLGNRDMIPEKFEEIIAAICKKGSYSHYFLQNVVKKENADTDAMSAELWRLAVKRVGDVAEFFALRRGTFLELFAVGKGREREFELCSAMGFFPRMAPDGLRQAAVVLSQLPMPGPLPRPFPWESEQPRGLFDEPGPDLSQSIRLLMDDFLGYIDLVRHWRDFVFSVRSLLNRKELDPELKWLTPSDEILRELVASSDVEAS